MGDLVDLKGIIEGLSVSAFAILALVKVWGEWKKEREYNRVEDLKNYEVISRLTILLEENNKKKEELVKIVSELSIKIDQLLKNG